MSIKYMRELQNLTVAKYTLESVQNVKKREMLMKYIRELPKLSVVEYTLTDPGN